MPLSKSQQTFLDKIWPSAVDASKQTGISPYIIAGQSALETGWGKSAPNNNYFGIKGPGGNQVTQEFVNGKWITITDSFKGYGSMAESVQGYADFINKNPRYTQLKNAGDLGSELAALQASGYATDPNYSKKVGSIVDTIKGVKNVGTSVQDIGSTTVAGIKDVAKSISTGDVKGAVNKTKETVGKVKDAAVIGAQIAAGDYIGAIKGILSFGKDAVEKNPVTLFLNWLKELFSTNTAARTIAIILGVCLIILALYALLQEHKDEIIDGAEKLALVAA